MSNPLIQTARRALTDEHIAEFTLRDLRRLVRDLADELERRADAGNYRAMFTRLAASARSRTAAQQTEIERLSHELRIAQATLRGRDEIERARNRAVRRLSAVTQRRGL